LERGCVEDQPQHIRILCRINFFRAPLVAQPLRLTLRAQPRSKKLQKK
jgi:hypothetical protein